MRIKRFNEINSSKYDEMVEDFMSGECIPFVVALKEIFPEYDIAVMNDIYPDENIDIEYNFNFVHVFCYNPKDIKEIIDVKGVRHIKDLYEDFFDINPEIDWDIKSSKQLIKEYADKEFYSEESYEYDEEEYLRAKEWILDNIERYKI